MSKPEDPKRPRQSPHPARPARPERLEDDAELRLERSRRLAEEKLAEVRDAVVEEAGRVPRNATLVLAGLAAAVGFALARRGRRRRSRAR